jgi:Asp-tRNA(Asn)/Glu-tRNA(Gln) amidotransferase A subunit family amidase
MLEHRAFDGTGNRRYQHERFKRYRTPKPMDSTSLINSNPLSSVAAALRSGERDLFDMIEQACDRLDALDRQIQAFLPEANRRARLRREAEVLMQQYPDPENRSALYGVLMGVKDMFRVDGFETRAGSELPAALFDGPEAACVRALRKAGALVLGKTVSTEFAYFEPGPTRNPHNLDHTPGGSSSGSAAAVAAGLCPLTIGTQTIASVIRPAAFCGVIGFKPSYGRIDPSGVIFIAPSLDHVGLFTQDVEGMILAASVLCEDWQPSVTTRPPVLGIPTGPYLAQASPEALQAFDSQAAKLESAGYTLRRIPMFDDIAEITQQHRALMAGEMAETHRNWFAQYESLYRPHTRELIQRGQGVTTEQLSASRDAQIRLRRALESRMRAEGIDLWISPAAKGTAPPGIQSTGDPVMSFPWTFAGLPTLTVPAGYSEAGLPFGLQCVAGAMQDEQLLAWAGQIARVVGSTSE